MAYAPENMLSTPQGYATPEQLQSMRQYATALQAPEQQAPVKHWLQGVDNVVKSLVGGNLSWQADAKQRAAINDAASRARLDYGAAPMTFPGTPAPVVAPRAVGSPAVPMPTPNPFLAQQPPIMDAGIYPTAVA